jgi:putative acetyltransferase
VEWQGRGIGSALITEGLAALKRSGAAGCVVLGEPAFSRRFGFERAPGLTFAAAPPEYFLAYAFKEPLPASAVSYHQAFSITG